MIYSEVKGGHRAYTMGVQHVQALTDGQFFLEHGLHTLRHIAIEPYCRHCHAMDLVPTVLVTCDDDQFEFRCQHRSGWVKRNRFLDVQPLLTALGWDLRCTKCKQLIEANNARTNATFLVTCPCTIRTMANPAAQAHAAA